MGLDQYAYSASKAGVKEEWYENARWNGDDFVNDNPLVEKHQELAYWRKHPNLQGWMEDLYRSRGGEGTFNCVEMELTMRDLFDLEIDITEGKLPGTTGFFFGENSDNHYRDDDLEFIKKARQAIQDGLKVFYNSSW